MLRVAVSQSLRARDQVDIKTNCPKLRVGGTLKKFNSGLAYLVEINLCVKVEVVHSSQGPMCACLFKIRSGLLGLCVLSLSHSSIGEGQITIRTIVSLDLGALITASTLTDCACFFELKGAQNFVSIVRK